MPKPKIDRRRRDATAARSDPPPRPGGVDPAMNRHEVIITSAQRRLLRRLAALAGMPWQQLLHEQYGEDVAITVVDRVVWADVRQVAGSTRQILPTDHRRACARCGGVTFFHDPPPADVAVICDDCVRGEGSTRGPGKARRR